MTNETSDPTAQPVPDETQCPYCGAPPDDDSVVEHRLSACGYVHDDIELQCRACDESWFCGVPITSDTTVAPDLYCPSCSGHRMLVHRVQLLAAAADDPVQFRLHQKCPQCYYFTTTTRVADHRATALVGYDAITGDTEAAGTHYGYPEDADGPVTVAEYGLDADPTTVPDPKTLETSGWFASPAVLSETAAADVCPEPACIEHGNGTVGCPLPAIEQAVLAALRD